MIVVGTEHILLGLIKEPSGVVAAVFKAFDLDPDRIQLEVVKFVQPGAQRVTARKLPSTPRAKMVVALAVEEARSMGQQQVGDEHMLLGLLCEEEGVAACVLRNLGLTVEAARKEVLKFPRHGTSKGGLS